MNSVRDAFFNRVYELICNGEDIVVVTADLGAPSLDNLRKNFPERYISVGIAEQNLIAVASGLALSGMGVIAYGLSPFPVTRAYDQLRNILAELNIPVTVCGLNAGLCSAECGFTHMPIDDIGMLRMLPNMEIFTPSDQNMSIQLAESVRDTHHPRFIRFDKAIYTIENSGNIDFNLGFQTYGSKSGIAIVTSGIFVQELKTVIEQYILKNQKIGLINVFKMPVKEIAFKELLMKFDKILTIEEHILCCGLGSYVLEIMNDYNVKKRVRRLGINLSDKVYKVYTNRSYIQKNEGIDLAGIQSMVEEMIYEN